MYDRNVRPTAIHEPNLAKRFTVPENVAVWNRTKDSDENHLSDGHGRPAPIPGQYISLPLDGRYDLMMPQPEPVPEPVPEHMPAAPHTREPHPAHIAEPQQGHEEGQQLQTHHTPRDHATAPRAVPVDNNHHKHHTPSPQPHEYTHAAWDGSRGPPPKESQPEMATAVDNFYAPAWDEPARSQGAYYQEHQDRFSMPTLPSNVLKNDWYGDFTHTVPDPKKVGSAFPWEEKGSTPRAEASRKFPQQHSALPPPPVAPKADKPSTATQPYAPVQPAVPTQVPTAADPPVAQPAPSFNEAMAEYTNAWDADVSIGRYAKRLTDLGIVTSRRKTGMYTVPPSPRRTSRHLPPAPWQDSNDSGSAKSAHNKRSSYEDKGTQTDRTPQNDAIVQASPETSPFSENPPSPVRKMISVATTPVTPPGEQGLSKPGVKLQPQTSYFPATTTQRAATKPATRAPPRGRVWDPETDIDVMRRHQALTQFGR